MSTDIYTLEPHFVGLKNFSNLISEPRFWSDVGRTAVFSVGTAVGSVIMGFFIAMMLHWLDFKHKHVLLTLFFLPWVLSWVSTGYVWRWVLHPVLGPIPPILKSLGLPFEWRDFLGDPDTALAVVTFVHIWKHIPFTMIITFAGLQVIPKNLYEASAIDGANLWQQLRFMTIPLLRPIMTIIALLLIIWQFGAFDIFKVMTRGGPAQSSEVLPLYIFLIFEQRKFGMAATVSLFLYILALMLILIYLRGEFERLER